VLYLESLAPGRGSFALRSLASSENVVYDIPCSSAYPKPDPDKVRAIQEMKPPSNISELRRFLGMVNQLSKFSPT
jgi:hypothetical protein